MPYIEPLEFGYVFSMTLAIWLFATPLILSFLCRCLYAYSLEVTYYGKLYRVKGVVLNLPEILKGSVKDGAALGVVMLIVTLLLSLANTGPCFWFDSANEKQQEIERHRAVSFEYRWNLYLKEDLGEYSPEKIGTTQVVTVKVRRSDLLQNTLDNKVRLEGTMIKGGKDVIFFVPYKDHMSIPRDGETVKITFKYDVWLFKKGYLRGESVEVQK